ncbi:MAG: helix-turn-helix transcriptional regulator [Silicimonas sp.]|nr:helix-turn-helix transcriptional regulator [Silicimonas sp.]
MKESIYGQYCPIAISLELLGGRWTMLIIRELIDGSSRFNDIHRGVPLMSRSLLSTRLKELEVAKLVSRTHSAQSGHAEYSLTEGGRSLLSVVVAVGKWGQEWLNKSPHLDDIDGGYLMWNIRKTSTWIEEMGPRAVVRFEYSDWDEDHRFHWLVIEESATDLCYIDPGHEVDVWISTDLRTMVEVWMGWRPLRDALDAGDISIDGHSDLVRDPLRWIGQSPLAGIRQRPTHDQVGRIVEAIRA